MYLYDVCFLFFYYFFICENINQAKMNKDYYYNETMNFLLKSTIRGLLVETPKVFSVLRV